MKKLLVLFAVIGLFATASMAQEDEDILAMDDTLSIDDMDPVFYEAEEGSSSSSTTTTILIVVGIVVVAGGVYYFTKKKKN